MEENYDANDNYFATDAPAQTITPKIKIVFKGKKEDAENNESQATEESPSKLKIKIKAPSLEVEEGSPHKKRKEESDEYNIERRDKSVENNSEGSDRTSEIRKTLGSVLNNIIKKDRYQLFNDPVSAEEVPDYHTIITSPMDFFTMRKKLRSGKYTSFESFEHDFHLICSNAMMYNAPNTVYYKEAKKLLTKGDQIIESYKDQFAPSINNSTTNTTTTTTTSNNNIKRNTSKNKDKVNISTNLRRRPSTAIATSSGTTKYSMYIPKNTNTLLSQNIDTPYTNLNIYNNYVDNYMYTRPSNPIYAHNSDSIQHQPIKENKYFNSDNIKLAQNYLDRILLNNNNSKSEEEDKESIDKSSLYKHLDDLYNKYSSHIIHDQTISLLAENSLKIQQLQILQSERTNFLVSESENVTFHSLAHNLLQMTVEQSPSDIVNQKTIGSLENYVGITL